MSMKDWEKKVLSQPGAAARVAEIEDELRLAVGLTTLREQAGLSQRDLAQRLGVTQPRIAAIEKSRNVTVDVLEQYVGAVGGQLEITVKKGRSKIPLLTPRSVSSVARRAPIGASKAESIESLFGTAASTTRKSSPSRKGGHVPKGERTAKAAASRAGQTLAAKAPSKPAKSAAASALAQTKSSKVTSAKAASAAAKTLGSKTAPKSAKSAAGSALTQKTARKSR